MTHSHGRLKLSADVKFYAVLYITQIETRDLELGTGMHHVLEGGRERFAGLNPSCTFACSYFSSEMFWNEHEVLKCVIWITVIFCCCRMPNDSRRAQSSVVSSSSSDPRSVLLWKTVPNQPRTQPLFLLFHCVKGSWRVGRSPGPQPNCISHLIDSLERTQAFFKHSLQICLDDTFAHSWHKLGSPAVCCHVGGFHTC